LAIDQIMARMIPVFREVFDDEELLVTPTTTASDVENWDSLSNIRLMVAMEMAFDVRLTGAEVSRLGNVGELAALIQSKS
jgi:acyl carrier protein